MRMLWCSQSVQCTRCFSALRLVSKGKWTKADTNGDDHSPTSRTKVNSPLWTPDFYGEDREECAAAKQSREIDPPIKYDALTPCWFNGACNAECSLMGYTTIVTPVVTHCQYVLPFKLMIWTRGCLYLFETSTLVKVMRIINCSQEINIICDVLT